VSVDIARELREEAGKASEVADRVSNPDDRKALVLLAARRIGIANWNAMPS